MSLPRILKTTLATVPAEIPYLSADPELARQWQRALSRYAGFKIGIAWQGDSHYQRDMVRSIPLRHFAPLAQLEGVVLFSLQEGPGREQIQALGKQFAVIHMG